MLARWCDLGRLRQPSIPRTFPLYGFSLDSVLPLVDRLEVLRYPCQASDAFHNLVKIGSKP
jgi:hypothetical protein